jgi:hypothetical protein
MTLMTATLMPPCSSDWTARAMETDLNAGHAQALRDALEPDIPTAPPNRRRWPTAARQHGDLRGQAD